MAGGEGDQRWTPRDFVALGVQGITSGIAHPNVDAKNLDLRPTLISMVQQSLFGETLLQDPNLHLSVF